MTEDKKKAGEREASLRNAEADANMFNLKCMAVLAMLVILAEGFNELGLFKVHRGVMLTGTIAALITFFMPIVIHLFSCLPNRRRAEEQGWFRSLVVACAFIGTGVMCIALSFHTVLLMAIPPLIAAQYRERRGEFVLVLIATILLVPTGVYGSFLFGTADLNFIKGMITAEEALVLENRLALLTTKRFTELLLHYVFPRLLSVIAIDVLAYGIIRRNSRFLDEQIALSEKVRGEMESRRRMQDQVIEALANLIETRDAGTGEHIIRTREYVEMIARAMQADERCGALLTDDVIERMKEAAPLHDVGKITVPDRILLKPGRLTDDEFDVMKTHAAVGGDIIEKLFKGMDDSAFLRMAEEIAVSHHERWDGTGYPNGLKGEEIPLSARVMAVADVFDALVSVRVYKGAIPPRDALNIIYSENGTHFDPEIIRIVKGIEGELIDACEGRKD